MNTIEEHAVVCFLKPFEGLPIGTKGTVVHIYKDAAAYEVELPNNRLVTVKPEYLWDTGWREGEAYAARKITEMLKSGEITQDDIINAVRKIEGGSNGSEQP